jgi:hypothetical protein
LIILVACRVWRVLSELISVCFIVADDVAVSLSQQLNVDSD